MENLLWYAGRLLFGGYFLYGGYNHFANAGMMAGYAQSKGIPSAKAAVIGSGLLLLIGGVSVIFNIYVTIGMIALALFLIPVSFTMHAYWKLQEPGSRVGEMVNFTKNLALLGAVLILMSR